MNSINYDYFIVCDSEIDIVLENFSKENILNKINKIYENKIIYAGEIMSETRNMVTQKCASLFKNKSINEFKNITNNFTLYYWWSDLPVYKRTHLEDFFNSISIDNLDWYHFDHMIYLNYLILYHNFTILNITKLI